MKLPTQTIFVTTSARSWLYRCLQATRAQLYLGTLQQSIRSLSKDRPNSPIFLQPCWPQGQPTACLCNAGSRALQGKLIPALGLGHSSYLCSRSREPAASSWESIPHQISNHPGLLGRAQLLLFAQPPAKSGIEMPGPFSHHRSSVVGRLLTGCSSPHGTPVLEVVTKKGLGAVCSASLALPQDTMLRSLYVVTKG